MQVQIRTAYFTITKKNRRRQAKFPYVKAISVNKVEI